MNRPSYKELLFYEREDREEQLRWIKDAVNGSAKFYREPPYSYEEELAREIMQLHTRIAELEAERRWIPFDWECKENQPDHMQVCLVLTTDNEMYSAMFLSDNCWTGLCRDFGRDEVAYWMPLPEPPEVK